MHGLRLDPASSNHWPLGYPLGKEEELGSRGQLVSFSLQHHRQSHETQHRCLQPWVLAQQDRDIADKGHVAHHAADDVLGPIQIALSSRVELGIVRSVVVAFRQEL